MSNGAKKDKSFIAMLVLIIVCACLMIAAATTLGVGMAQNGGQNGNESTSGSRWWTVGDGEKDSLADAKVGDFYLDADGNIYVKGESGWGDSVLNIKGVDGESATVEIDEDGYWVINGVKTGHSALGSSPKIGIDEDGYWTVNGERLLDEDNKPVRASHSFEIKDGYWYIDGEKTYPSVGQNGKDGAAWHSGENEPAASLGKDGDFYLDTKNGVIYEKDGDWKVVAELSNSGFGSSNKVAQWFYGKGEPKVVEGAKEGDFYVDTDKGNVYQYTNGSWGDPVFCLQGEKGEPGTPGTPGKDGDSITGKDGSTWYLDTEDPTADDGEDGDFWLNTTDWTVHHKENGAWNELGSIKGDKGDTGSTGPEGPKGENGKDGEDGNDGKDGKDGATWHSGKGAPAADLGNEGDFYFNEETGDIYKKTADGWGNPIVNLTGEKGDKGDEGDKGDKGDNGEDGATWFVGDGHPADTNPEGVKKGDFYLNALSGDIYECTNVSEDATDWALRGNIRGTRGVMWFVGEEPDEEDILEGDLWLDEDGDIHRFQDGEWVETGINLKGDEGEKGETGEAGTKLYVGSKLPTAGEEYNEGDLYLYINAEDSENSYNLYKYENGKWTPVGNVKGDKGDKGETGVRGSLWFVGEDAPEATDEIDGEKLLAGDLYLDYLNGVIYEFTGEAWKKVASLLPYIDEETGNWWVNGNDTGVSARGKDGDTPFIKDGTWWIGDTNTGVEAKGPKGDTPYIKDGTWWIGEDNLNVPAVGQDGKDGKDGGKPFVGEDGYWYVEYEDEIVETGVKATGLDGKDGATWFTGAGIPVATQEEANEAGKEYPGEAKEGDLYLDTNTGIIYRYSVGAWKEAKISILPEVGADGYWYINGKNTGARAAVSVAISEDGYWVINGEKTNDRAVPTVELGNDGYWYINGEKTEVRVNVWRSGALEEGKAPDAELGFEGDLFFNVVNGDVWQKTAEGWGEKAVLNVTGQKGDRGSMWFVGNGEPTDAAALETALGGETLQVNDLYINLADGYLWQYVGENDWNKLPFTIMPKDGVRGTMWFVGEGDPNENPALEGEELLDGDYYLEAPNGDIWRYNGEEWVDIRLNIRGVRGSKWFAGAEAPTEGVLVGDFWYDTTTGDVYEYVESCEEGCKLGGGENEHWHWVGNLKGADGATWHIGEGAPAADLGKAGDFYLDKLTYKIYSKTTGLGDKPWELVGSIHASVWYHGHGVPTSSQKVSAGKVYAPGLEGDYYINLDNGDLYYHNGKDWESLDSNIYSGWYVGAGEPAASIGKVGSYYFRTDVAEYEMTVNGAERMLTGYAIYEKTAKGWVVVSVLETKPAKQSRAWFSGNGNPNEIDFTGKADAEVGDFYLNLAEGDGNGDVYELQADGSWEVIGNIQSKGDSARWIIGSGDPNNNRDLDNVEDGTIYLDQNSENKNIWQKDESVGGWVYIGCLQADRGTNNYYNYPNPNDIDTRVNPLTDNALITDSRKGDFYFRRFYDLGFGSKIGLEIWVLEDVTDDDIEEFEATYKYNYFDYNDDEVIDRLTIDNLYWHLIFDLTSKSTDETKMEYEIPDLYVLRAYRDLVNGSGVSPEVTYKVIDSITVTEDKWEAIGTAEQPMNGILTGLLGEKGELMLIDGLTAPLFGYIGAGAQISNLHISSAVKGGASELTKYLNAPYGLAENVEAGASIKNVVVETYFSDLKLTIRTTWDEEGKVFVEALGDTAAVARLAVAANELTAEVKDFHVMLDANVNYSFTKIKFTGNSYIDLSKANASITIDQCYAEVNITDSGIGGFLHSSGNENTVTASLEMKQSVIIDASNGTGAADSIRGIYTWNKFESVTLTDNVFGSSELPFYNHAVKLMSHTDGATYEISGNTVYLSAKYGKVYAFDLYQNNSRDLVYTATLSANTVVTDKTEGANFLRVNVNGAEGHGQVYLLGTKNSIDGDTSLYDHVVCGTEEAFNFIGFNVELDDAGMILSGDFYLGEQFGEVHHFKAGNLEEFAAPQSGDVDWHNIVIFDYTFEDIHGFTQHLADWRDTYYVNNENGLGYFRDTVNGTNYAAGWDSNDYANYTVVLTSDETYDLSGINWEPIGSNGSNPFNGTFDGASKVIENLHFEGIEDCAGLFGYIGSGAIVTNFTINNVSNKPYIENDEYGVYVWNGFVGAAVGLSNGAKEVSHITVTGDIELVGYQYVGGIIGRANYNSSETVNIHHNKVEGKGTLWATSMYLGGIVGYSQHANLTDNVVSGITLKEDWYLHNEDEVEFTLQGRLGGIAGIVSGNVEVSGNIVESVVIDTEWLFHDVDCYFQTVGAILGTYTGSGNITVANNTVENVTVNSPNAELYNGGLVGNRYVNELLVDSTPSNHPAYSGNNAELIWRGVAHTYEQVEKSEEVVANFWHVDDVDMLKAFADYVNGDSNFKLPEDIYGEDNITNIPGRTFSNELVKLTADIDLKDEPWTPIGIDKNHAFNGTFEGGYEVEGETKAHTIKGLNVVDVNNYAGLFGVINSYASVKNLVIDGATVKAEGNYAGALAGWMRGDIENVTLTGNVSVEGYGFVGGLVGDLYGNVKNSKVVVEKNSESHVKATGGDPVDSGAGGLIGLLGEGNYKIVDCASNIEVVGVAYAGGLIGTAVGAATVLNGKVLDTAVHLNYKSANNNTRDTRAIGGIVGRVLGALTSNEETEYLGWMYVNGEPLATDLANNGIAGNSVELNATDLAHDIRNSRVTLYIVDGFGYTSDWDADSKVTDYYSVSKANGLAYFSNTVKGEAGEPAYDYATKLVKLIAEITSADLATVEFAPIGVENAAFAGIFEGEYHTISGLTNSLFGYTNGATVTNLTLDNVNVIGESNVGALIGMAMGTTVTNITVNGDVTADHSVGGVVGLMNGGSLTNVAVNGTVSMNGGDLAHARSIGGLVGVADELTISNGKFEGTIANNYADDLNLLVYNYGFVGSSATEYVEAANDSWVKDNDTVLGAAKVVFENSSTLSADITSTRLNLNVVQWKSAPYAVVVSVSDAEGLMGLAKLVNGGEYEGAAVTFKGEENFAGEKNTKVLLTKNIDLSTLKDVEWKPIGTDADHAFKGVFESADANKAHDIRLVQGSLFGYTDGASISNINLVDTAVWPVDENAETLKGGALVATAVNTAISDVTIDGFVQKNGTELDAKLVVPAAAFAAAPYGIVGSETNSSITNVNISLKLDEVRFTAEVDKNSNAVVKYAGIVDHAELKNEYFVLTPFTGKTVEHTFDNLYITGDSYIATDSANAKLTIMNSLIDAEPTAKEGNAYGFIMRRTGNYTLNLIGNEIYNGGSQAFLISWGSLTGESVISGNQFGSNEHPYSNAQEAIIKPLEFDKVKDNVAASLLIKDNMFYVTREDVNGDGRMMKVVELHQNNNRAEAYDALFDGNEVIDVTPADASKTVQLYLVHVNVNLTANTHGSAQVLILDNNTVAGRDVLASDINRVPYGGGYTSGNVNDGYNYIGYNVTMNDAGEIIKGDFFVGGDYYFDGTDLKTIDEYRLHAMADLIANSGIVAAGCEGDVHLVIADGFGRRLSDVLDEDYNTFYMFNVAGVHSFVDLVNAGMDFSGLTVKFADELAADHILDLAQVEEGNWAPIGDAEHAFNGTFDGSYVENGEKKSWTITGLRYVTATGTNDPTEASIGFFGYTNGATITNLNFTEVYIEAKVIESGAVVGTANGGEIMNVTVAGTIYSSQYAVGGVVGTANGTAFTTVSSDVTVEGLYAVGGVVGLVNGGKYNDIHSNADVTTNGINNVYRAHLIGGVIGAVKGSDLVELKVTGFIGTLTRKATGTYTIVPTYAHYGLVGGDYAESASGAENSAVKIYASYIDSDLFVAANDETDKFVQSTDWDEVTANKVTSNYYVTGLEALKYFRDTVNSGKDFVRETVYLAADVDLGGEEWEPIGKDAKTPFRGSFDGSKQNSMTLLARGENIAVEETNKNIYTVNGKIYDLTAEAEAYHIISNLTVNNHGEHNQNDGTCPGNNFAGLFGTTGQNSEHGTFSNVMLVTVRLDAADYVGALVGQAYTSDISNIVVVDAELKSHNRAGGVAGAIYGGVKDSAVYGIDVEVTPQIIWKNLGTAEETRYYDDGAKVGGLVGQSYEGRFTFDGNTVAEAHLVAWRDVGGLVGVTQGSTFTNNTVKNSKIMPVHYDDSEIKYVKDENGEDYAVNANWLVGRVIVNKTYTESPGANVEGGTYNNVRDGVEVDYTESNMPGFFYENGVWHITSLEGLYAFHDAFDTSTKNGGEYNGQKFAAHFAGETVVLDADIDLAESADGISAHAETPNWEPIGNKTPDVFFQGNFDGQGHTIKNMYVNSSDAGDYYGFFSRIANNVEIKNIVFENPTVIGTEFVGVLAGRIGASGLPHISNITVKGDVKVEGTGAFVGGVVGHFIGSMNNVTINANPGSYVKGQTELTNTFDPVGGVVGMWQPREGVGKNSDISTNIDVYGINCVSAVIGRLGGAHEFENVTATGNVIVTGDSCEDGAADFTVRYSGDVRGEVIVRNFHYTGKITAPKYSAFVYSNSTEHTSDFHFYNSTSTLPILTHDEDGETALDFAYVATADSKGVITEEYQVYTKEGLKYFRDTVNGNNDLTAYNYSGDTVRLMADVDLAGENWEPIGKDADHRFAGVFTGHDGSSYLANARTISNLTIGTPEQHYDAAYAGLFGFVRGTTNRVSGGVIKNITINNVTIYTDKPHAGAVAGWLFINSDTTRDVETDRVQYIMVRGKIVIESDYEGEAFVGGIFGHFTGHIWRASVGYSDVMTGSSYYDIDKDSHITAIGKTVGGMIGGTDEAGVFGEELKSCIPVIGSGYVGGVVGIANADTYWHNVKAEGNITLTEGDGFGIGAIAGCAQSGARFQYVYYNSSYGVKYNGDESYTPSRITNENKNGFTYYGLLGGDYVEGKEILGASSFVHAAMYEPTSINAILADGFMVQAEWSANGELATDNRFVPLTGKLVEMSYYAIVSVEGLEYFRDTVHNGHDFTGENVYIDERTYIDDPEDKYFGYYGIDLAGSAENPWTPIGTADHPFNGTFGVYGYVLYEYAAVELADLAEQLGGGLIRNLYVESTEANVGFFGVLGPNAYVSSIAFENVHVVGGNGVGAVAGMGQRGVNDTSIPTVVNVNITGTMKVQGGSWVGGIVGYMYANVMNCTIDVEADASGNVLGSGNQVGGLRGHMENVNPGHVTISGNTLKNVVVIGKNAVGGLLGISNGDVTLTNNTLHNVKVSATNASANRVGALAGYVYSWNEWSKTLLEIDGNKGNVTVTTGSDMVGDGLTGAIETDKTCTVERGTNEVKISWNGIIKTSSKHYQANDAASLLAFAAAINAAKSGDDLYSWEGPNQIVYLDITADIDLDGALWTPMTGNFVVVNGNHHTVSNFTIGANSIGKSAFIDGIGATIKNLTLADVTAEGAQAAAFFANTEGNATLQNCALDGNVTITYKAYESEGYGAVGAFYGVYQPGDNAVDLVVKATAIVTIDVTGLEAESKIGANGTAKRLLGYHNGTAPTDTVKVEEGAQIILKGLDVEVDEKGNASVYSPEGLVDVGADINENPSKYAGKTVTLENDIDLSDVENWEPIKAPSAGAGAVGRMTFEGNNKTISNLTISTKSGNTGFFATFGNNGDTVPTVKNLTFDGATITGKGQYTGILAGSAMAHIENVHVTGLVQITGTYFVGVIAGHNNTGSATNCSVDVEDGSFVTGSSYNVGGMFGAVGYNGGKVTNCSVNNIEVKGSYYVGGLIGRSVSETTLTLTNCHVTNTMVTKTSMLYTVGGLIGNVYTGSTGSYKNTVTDCSFTGVLYNRTTLVKDATAMSSLMGSNYSAVTITNTVCTLLDADGGELGSYTW